MKKECLINEQLNQDKYMGTQKTMGYYHDSWIYGPAKVLPINDIVPPIFFQEYSCSDLLEFLLARHQGHGNAEMQTQTWTGVWLLVKEMRG